jgi:outer membrane receptor protein involved in Fe transport
MRRFQPLALGFALSWLTATSALSQPATLPDTPIPTNSASDPFSMDLESLLNVKVTTASKFSESLSDAPGVISVVTKDELRRFGGTTLGEVLARVAGLNVSSGFFADRSIIGARGDQTRPDGGHILFLINGRPVREILEGGVSSDLLESFPIGVLERIEIIKGPGSVLYGSDAFSGVINLITKKADGSGFHASGAGGASGEAASSEEISFERGALSIVEGGQYHQLPDWQTLYRSSAGPSKPVAGQTATLRDEGTGGYLGINYKGLSFMSSYTALESPTFVRGIVGDARSKRGFTDLGYSLKASAKWEMTFNGTYTRDVLDAPDYPKVHRDSYEGLLEWTNFITFSQKDRLTFGTLYDHIQGTETLVGVTPTTFDAQGSRNSGSFYAQYEHSLTQDLKLIGGLQANKIGSIALNAVPRAGILWTATDRLTFKALYGNAFHAPSLDDTLLNHPGLKGNPNLTPETVGTLDLQVSYGSNRLQASVDYFHSRQMDLIVEDGTTLPAHYYNLGTPVTFQGLDSEGKYYLKGNWFLTGALLYQFNNDSWRAGNVMNAIPKLGAKAGVSYLAANGVELSMFDSYQGHLPGYATSLNPSPDAFHSVDAHARFDLSKRWMKNDARGLALFVHANDLLNQPVWLPALGTGLANTIPVNRGRTILFGIEIWQKAE